MLCERRFRDGNELSSSRPDHWGDHEALCQTQTLTALSLVEQQNRVDESEHAVRIAVKREQLDLGFGTAVLQCDRAGVGGWLHDRAIKRPAAQYRPEPAISPVVVLRDDRHRGALRATTSRLAKKDVFREHREAHLVQVISRCLLVSGRLPSGRLHVAENERRKARLARIGKSSGAECYHHVSSYGFRVPAQAAAVSKPRCVVDLVFFFCGPA